LKDLLSSGCFFLDTTILLSQILKENSVRIEKLKNDIKSYKIPCYISDSVQNECKDKIEKALNFVGQIVKDTINLRLEEERTRRRISLTSPISSDDIIALEKTFSLLHGAMKASHKLTNPIEVIEEWTIKYLGEKLEQGTIFDKNQFMMELVKNILKVTSSIQDPYDELVTFERSFARKINVVIDLRIVDSLLNIDIHKPDSIHLACAWCHQINSNERTVFVTFDFSSIISKQDEIRKLLNLVCCDPLYAIYHLVH